MEERARLPSLFSAAAAWSERLQSEVEAGAALDTLVDRVDLTDIGVRVSLKLRTPKRVKRPATHAQELIVTRFFPMTIRRRGVEMRLAGDFPARQQSIIKHDIDAAYDR